MKHAIMTIAFACLLILSCNKSETTETKQSYKPLNFKELNIGELHNQYVIQMYNNYKKSLGNRLSTNETTRQRLYAEMRRIPYDATPIGITNDQFYAKVIEYTSKLEANYYEIRNYSTPPCSPIVYGYVIELTNSIDNLNTLEEMYAAFDALQTKASTETRGLDLDIITFTLQIARSSTYLWSPKSMGGYDLMELTSNPSNLINLRTLGGGWKGVLKGDLYAATGFIFEVGIGAVIGGALTPGTNLAILGGWAISTGVGSAMAAVLPRAINIPNPKPKDGDPIPQPQRPEPIDYEITP